jgi:hypothetical protein
MAQNDNAPHAPDYVSSARLYAFDLAATTFLLVTVSIMAGRIWRFPFDDEIATLSKIQPEAARAIIAVFPATYDIHPPLSYAVFYGLRQLGLTDAGMRICSLAMTALALLLCQLLVLRWIAQRNGAMAPAPTRLVAVLMFGLMPMAVSQGDALRWYPVFALLSALFVTLYLVPRDGLAQLWSSVVLGLAASTDFSAILIVPPLLIYRYALQRRFRWSFDLAYWLITAAGAAIGFFSACWIFVYRTQSVQVQFASGIVRAGLTDVLGFFGGDALGVSQAWVIVPAVVVFAIAAISEIDRREPDKPVHLFLLMLSGPVLMALAGFSAPRSFLYLTPVVAGLLTMFFDRQLHQGHAIRMLSVVLLTLTTSISAIANINSGTHPFKRNSVVPYQSIFNFIDDNARGSALVLSTDPVVPWLLRDAGDDRCAGYFFAVVKRCLDAGRHYDSIFVIFGHSNSSADETFIAKFKKLIAEVTAGRSKVATLTAGRDDDAALKSRLSGVPLETTILTVDYYR